MPLPENFGQPKQFGRVRDEGVRVTTAAKVGEPETRSKPTTALAVVPHRRSHGWIWVVLFILIAGGATGWWMKRPAGSAAADQGKAGSQCADGRGGLEDG